MDTGVLRRCFATLLLSDTDAKEHVISWRSFDWGIGISREWTLLCILHRCVCDEGMKESNIYTHQPRFLRYRE